tara:strand:- start:440 stop:1336 length:897 start_codon:yes stop_codon:yes gene_type:complete
MSNILVTGGQGFIGYNLIKKLIELGHKVFSVDNGSTGKNFVDGCKYGYNDVSYQEQVSNFVKVHKEQNIEIIFHLASLARIQPSFKNPIKTMKNNFMGTLNMLEVAKNINAQFIYAGSSSRHHGLYKSPYAWSKFGGEELCKLYNNIYKLNTTICRFYNVYGPKQIEDGDYATVIGIFEKQYRDKQPLTIVGDGEQKRDFTHVDDIVSGLIACIGKKFSADVFELGRGQNYSINEVANMFGKNYPKKYIAKRKGEYAFTLADYTKALKELKYFPTKSLKSYIKSKIKTKKQERIYNYA